MGLLQSILGLFTNDQEVGDLNDQRVACDPSQARPGDTVRIFYQGLLKDSGAQDVYLHYGFDSWSSQPHTVKMEKTEDGRFSTAVPAAGNNEINFCFKDSAANWDNNSGYNWTLHLG